MEVGRISLNCFYPSHFLLFERLSLFCLFVGLDIENWECARRHILGSASLKNNACLLFYPGRGVHIYLNVLWPRLMLPLNFVVRSESWRCKGAAWEAAEEKEHKTWIQVFLPSTMLDRWSYLALKDSNFYWYSGSSPPLCLAEVEKKFHNRTLEKHILNISQFVRQESEGPN